MPRCSVEGALNGASAARGVDVCANQGSVTLGKESMAAKAR